jgi:hypothetical protein
LIRKLFSGERKSEKGNRKTAHTFSGIDLEAALRTGSARTDRLGSAKSERKSQARADNNVIVAQSDAADKNQAYKAKLRCC